MRACLLMLILPLTTAAAETVLATGLKFPTAACLGPGGKLHVCEIGKSGVAGDGRISVIENGQPVPVVEKLDDPRGLLFHGNAFYFVDRGGLMTADAKGKVSVVVAADKFAPPLANPMDIALEPRSGVVLVLDADTPAIHRVNLKSKKVETVLDGKTLKSPTSVSFDGETFALVADAGRGCVHRVNLNDKTSTVAVEGLAGPRSLTWDYFGRLFITSSAAGECWAIPRPGQKPVTIATGLHQTAKPCLDASGKNLLVTDYRNGRLLAISTVIPGWEVDESPMNVEFKLAFADMKWTGWDDGSDVGKVIPLRPVLLTHAGDGSHCHFVVIQQGVIHAFRDGDKATKVFLDISKKVKYADNQNEEGLLGLAFHPQFKTNGEFFVFYTDKAAKLTNVVSRFRVKKDDPTTADPASEEELLRIQKPFWNHDGGTLCIGPDGFLYITHGDGGAANDPHGNGQNLNTHLGKVLRIDVDKKQNGKNYAIPPDNPFATTPNAKPEIWAYGIRNLWRMAFDRETGKLWAGEVGQNLFEEIVVIEKGGNYGWSIRESLHPFGRNGVDVRKDLVEPIWEYHHDIGKSITGGHVYRGKAIPELQGHYLYADYVSPRCWALKYDTKANRVTANRTLPATPVAVMSFGENEAGEAYMMGADAKGRGIYKLEKKK